MGLFGGGKTQINVNIPEVKVPTAEELFSQGLSQARQISPLALGAREQGLANLGQLTPESDFFSSRGVNLGEISPDFFRADLGQISPSFFDQFQPTSFEQGISGTFFQDALNQAKRTAAHQSSLSGISSAFPELFSRAISPTLFNIGQFLAGQGQRRGELALGRENDLANLAQSQDLLRLGRQTDLANLAQRQAELALSGRQQGILSQLAISPQQEILPFAQLGQQQGNAQAELSQGRALQQAQIDIANQLKAMQPSGLGRLIGAGLGAAAAPFTGGLSLAGGIGLGSSLGGLVEGDFQLGDALGLMGGIGGLGKLSFMNPFGVGGAGIGGIGGVGGNLGNLGSLLEINPGRGLFGAIG